MNQVNYDTKLTNGLSMIIGIKMPKHDSSFENVLHFDY